MTNIVQSRYTSKEIAVWLRGLLTVAWADGCLDDEETQIITHLPQDEFLLGTELTTLTSITPAELAATLSHNPKTAENFLRTAVMVAIADGFYSQSEDQLLEQFCQVLEQPPTLLASLRNALQYHAPASASAATATPISAIPPELDSHHYLVLANPIQEWLDHFEVHDPRLAHFLCKTIPAHCPFERDVLVFGRKVGHIPPLCKLNPLYEQLMGLRFRALSYLAEQCGEDVTPYC
jgi:tellurite resistance protein